PAPPAAPRPARAGACAAHHRLRAAAVALGGVPAAVPVDAGHLAQAVAGGVQLPAELLAEQLRVAELPGRLDDSAVHDVPDQLADRDDGERGRQPAVVLAGGVRVRAAAGAGAGRAVPAAAGDADDPARGDDRAALPAVQPAGAGEHAVAAGA